MADQQRSSRIDPVAAIAGLIFLVVAIIGLTSARWWAVIDTWVWSGAGVLALIGLVLVLSAIPRRREPR